MEPTLTADMTALAPWHQRIRLAGDVMTPGGWDTEKQAATLREAAPWPIEGRVLDAGGNAGGIAIALQESAEEIVVLETNPLYQRQFEFVAQHRDTSRVRYLEESLFTAHSLGHFDVTLMLGLVYHFRHPQLFLDYCSHIECDRFVFSTQTRGGDDKHLWNRSQIPAYAGRGMLGWHPSKEAFKGMLEAASFRVDDEFQIRDPAFTNDYYVFCTRTGTVDVAVEPIIRIAHADSFWT